MVNAGLAKEGRKGMSDLAKIIERAKLVSKYGISLNILPEEIPTVLEVLENQLHSSAMDPIADALQRILDKENDKISGGSKG